MPCLHSVRLPPSPLVLDVEHHKGSKDLITQWFVIFILLRECGNHRLVRPLMTMLRAHHCTYYQDNPIASNLLARHESDEVRRPPPRPK